MEQTLYGYWPLPARPRLEWPNGARLAVWVGMNVEHYVLDRPSTSLTPMTASLVPDPLNYGWRDYGPRVGIWRLMELFDKYAMPVSVLLNAAVCDHYPEIITEGNRRHWAWLAHGEDNSQFIAGMTPEAEREYLTQAINKIRAATGTEPRGWLGPALTESFNTPDILGDLGITYLCDWCNDDQPYPLKTRRPMISVPYSIEINDHSLFIGHSTDPAAFGNQLIDQFDVLYEESATSGRVMAIALHPFVTGLPFRAKHLERALAYITQHEGVWLATSDQIADWYFTHYYDLAPASLKQPDNHV